jgi:hypothetical protein
MHMSEIQSIAKGLLGLTHPEVFASFGKRADTPEEQVPADKSVQSRFAALLTSLGRGAWLW